MDAEKLNNETSWRISLAVVHENGKELAIVRAELKRRECNAVGHAFVCTRRPFEF